VTDGGGQTKTALNIVRGADQVARLFAGLSKKIDPSLRYQVREVNGWPALAILQDAAIVRVAAIETDGAVIFGISVCMNPAKLAANLDLASGGAPPSAANRQGLWLG
jgi:RNA polymerase sigma-70 factor (ECF subfamily)